MESGASLATRNPCPLASPRVKVGLGTVRFPGFQRRMRGARLVATGAFGSRRSVSVENKLRCEPDEGGVGAITCGDHWRKNALECINGFGDFGVTTVAAIRAFKKRFSSIEDFIGEDHEDGDDKEEEGGHGDGKGSDDDDDEEDTTDDEDDEEDTTTDEEDTTEDEDEDEDEDEGECDD